MVYVRPHYNAMHTVYVNLTLRSKLLHNIDEVVYYLGGSEACKWASASTNFVFMETAILFVSEIGSYWSFSNRTPLDHYQWNALWHVT